MTEISTSKYKLNADKDNPRFINDGMNELERNIKRLIDMFAALICLVIFSPLFLICYIAIKREDGGPAIYKQERIGRFGRPFYIYKFRSMVVDAEKDGPALYKHDRETRMTKIGKFLRAHHLDELPQLWNVVKGEMAFIGPRPLLVQYLPLYNKEQARRHEVRPGITGWAQCHGRNSLSWTKKFELDVWYVDHVSLKTDLMVIWDTILTVIKRSDISHEGTVTMEAFNGNN